MPPHVCELVRGQSYSNKDDSNDNGSMANNPYDDDEYDDHYKNAIIITTINRHDQALLTL